MILMLSVDRQASRRIKNELAYYRKFIITLGTRHREDRTFVICLQLVKKMSPTTHIRGCRFDYFYF